MTKSPSTSPPLRARISPELTAGILVLFVTLPLSLFLVVRASAFTAQSPLSSPSPSEAASIALASVAPTPTAPPSPTPTATPAPNITTIRNALLINDRLAAARSSLLEMLAERPVSAASIAEELRDINVAINAGQSYASALTTSPETKQIGRQLLEVYDAIHKASVDTLAVSLQETGAYVQGAREIVRDLANLREPDRDLQDLAGG